MALDYFTLEEFRELPDMEDDETYSDERVIAVAEYVQGVVERVCNTSFVGRERTEKHDGTGTTRLLLRTPYVLEVDSVTVDGVETPDDLDGADGVLEYRQAGATYPGVWPRGRRNIEVVYTAGYSETPPPDVKEAVMQATRARLIDTHSSSKLNDRRSSISNPDGGTTTFVIAGTNQPTGYPEVDAVILGWAKRLNTVVFP